jgi:beta-lactamase regulating signal transducer with metallopeptidase domain
MASGTITIKKSDQPTFFAFTTRAFSASEHHRLTFQAQQEKTILTYEISHFRKAEVLFMLASMIVPKSLPSRNELLAIGKAMIRAKLLLLQAQMEGDID